MKFILFSLLLLSSCNLFSQVKPSQPKIRISSGVFTTKYELGDKDVKAKDVRAHLETTSPEAYYRWRKSESAGISSLIFSIVGLGGIIYAITATDDTQKAAGYFISAGGLSTSLVCALVSSARQEKAADIYNRKFGY
jgi:hypothetical protein